MSNRTVCNLINYFKELIESQKAIQSVKDQLQKLKGFNPMGLFRKIAGNEDLLSIKTLQSFMKEKVACNDREMYEIFLRFDHARQGFILPHDFCKEVTSASQTRKSSNAEPSKQIINKFLSLISVIIRSCRVLEVWRKEVQQIKPFIIFEWINKGKTGVISLREIFQFFFENGQQLNRLDAITLHTSLMGKFYKELNLETLCDNLKPLEFGYYTAYKHNLQNDRNTQIMRKQAQCRQANEIKENYLRERRNGEVVQLIHREAAMSREEELQKRIGDEVRAYQEVKYAIKKKYRPYLTFEDFLLLEREAEQINILKVQMRAQEARIKQQIYKNKIKDVEILRQVERFKENKYNFMNKEVKLQANYPQTDHMRREELQKRIRLNRKSQLNVDDLNLKRRVQTDLKPSMKIL